MQEGIIAGVAMALANCTQAWGGVERSQPYILHLVCRLLILCVLSGADPSEQWLRNNSRKVIFLKIFLLWKWDKEQMQKLSSRPGLTQGINAVGCFDQAPGLSYGTGEESLFTKACAVLGVQIVCWVMPTLLGEQDKSKGLCMWISVCL